MKENQREAMSSELQATNYTEVEKKRPTLPAEGYSCKKNRGIKLKIL